MEIDKAVEVFKKGKIVVFPTDTAIGIGCVINNEDAVKRIYEIKQRDYSKPLLVLVSSIEMARQYVEIPGIVEEKLLKYWPGGLTVILNCRPEKVSRIVSSGTNTLAVRFPNHKDILRVIDEVGIPIIATSANITGTKTPYKISQVDDSIISQVDHVMQGSCTFEQQSTIVDSTITPWQVIREGVVKIEL